MNARRASIVALGLILVLNLWWRGHTIAGTVKAAWGVSLWPVVAPSEPLDCDESIYGYIGKRIANGDVMYRDLTENKPPLGYWLYAMAVAIGGPSETTIRVMPMPMVLITIALVWWIAGRLAGPISAVVAALIYAIMSTDPYLYGNGANMEHAINLFATASLALMVRGWSSDRRGWLVAAGVGATLAAMIKQVEVVPLAALGLALLTRPRPLRSRAADLGALALGFAAVAGGVLVILWAQGALQAAYQDIVLYGGSMARDTPRDPKEYPFFVRWVVGNTDPNGLLPWPFGRTLGRAWWAAGCWPLWIVSIPALGWVGFARGRPERKLVASWTVASWVAVAMPRLFWQHYFLLPLPGVAIVVAIALGDGLEAWKGRRRWAGLVSAALLGAAIGATVAIQVREYLLVEPERITERDKGGRQWVVLREFGRELGRRTRAWPDARLWVWGNQSPLTFYSGLDNVTPQIFADPLMVAFAPDGGDHPQVRPRLERTMRDLRARKPDLIFVGERPFPELTPFLRAEYLPSKLFDRGLWVRIDRSAAFEAAASPD